MPLLLSVRQRRAKTTNNAAIGLLIIYLFDSGLIAWRYNTFGIIKKNFQASLSHRSFIRRQEHVPLLKNDPMYSHKLCCLGFFQVSAYLIPSVIFCQGLNFYYFTCRKER